MHGPGRRCVDAGTLPANAATRIETEVVSSAGLVPARRGHGDDDESAPVPVPVWCRWDGTRPADNKDYSGKRNCYFNIDTLRLPVSEDPVAIPALADQIAATEVVLPNSAQPWNDKDPWHLLDGSLAPAELLAAFKLDYKTVDGLLLKDPQAVVGMKETPWGSMEWTPDDIARLGGKSATVKVVDPTQKTNTEQRVYQSLKEACGGQGGRGHRNSRPEN